MTRQELEERDLQDIRAIFQTREGARFFSRLIQYCGVYRMSINDYNAEDTHHTAFCEGCRGVGLEVLSWLQRVDENAAVKLFSADKERKVTE